MVNTIEQRKTPEHIVYICTTYYHVYIAVAKILLGAERADMVICDDIDEHSRLCDALRRSHIPRNLFFFDGKRVPPYDPKNKIEKVFLQHRRHKRLVESVMSLDLRKYVSVFIFHDGTKLGKYLQDAKIPYHLLEDSLNYFKIIRNTQGQAELPPKNRVKLWLKYYGGIGYLPCGQNRFCRSIEVNDELGLEIGHRLLRERPRTELLEALDDDQRKKIYDVFVDARISSALQRFHAKKKKIVLILTNPLFCDQFVQTESMQVSIYQDIINCYERKGFEVIIKPHPRDQVSYCKHFPALLILDKNFPAEVLNYGKDIFFDEVATIFSSAIDTLTCVGKKMSYGFGFLDNYKSYLTQAEKERREANTWREEGAK